jgi:Bacterial SH3 domain
LINEEGRKPIMFLMYTQDSDPPTNVRSAPSVNSQKVDQLQNHTVITVVKRTDNNWLKISRPISGFIYAELAQPATPQFDRNRVGSIAAWQHLLNGCGYHPNTASKLAITGKFDAETIAVTKKLQQNLQLSQMVDEIDLLTWQAAFDHKKVPGWLPILPSILGQNVQPPGDSWSESQKYDYCQQVILSHGGFFQDDVNKRNLLSFRQETSTKAKDWKGEYDDWTFLIWKDSSQQKRCRKYKSSTEPSSWFEDSSDPKAKGPIMGQDANGDGRKDLGRLQEGYYEYQIGSSNKYCSQNTLGNVLKPTAEAMTVIRDIDHDGIFESHEPMLGADDMFFHTGRYNRTGSAGCQTMPPDEYSRFWKDLTANGTYKQDVIGYTIVRWKSLVA